MNTPHYAIVLPLLLGCASMAQVCQSPSDGVGAPLKRGVEIPITIHGGGVFVPVVMNDGQTYSFLLDSGFEGSVLDSSTVRAVGLRSTKSHSESAPGGKVETASVSGVHRRVGGIALANDSLTTLDLSGFAPLLGHRLNGILGYDFFQQFVVVLDYQHQRLTLCVPKTFRAPGAHPIPLSLESHQPYIDVQVEGTNGKSVHASIEVDTGKVDPFSLNASFARRNGLLANPSALLALKGISLGGETQAWLTRAKSLVFGKVSIKNPVMVIAEEDADRDGQL